MNDTAQKLQPCLAELLRTCIKPNSIILRVDRIVTQETTADLSTYTSPPGPTKTITRFHLTDGELVIQALLQPILLADYDLNVGDRVEVRDFVVRKARRLNGGGKIIYLGIQDFAVLSQHRPGDWDGEGGFLRSAEEERLEPAPKRRKGNTNRVAFTGIPDHHDGSAAGSQLPQADDEASLHLQKGGMVTDEDAESGDEFESLNVNLTQVRQRRQMLHVIQQASTSATSPSNENGKPRSQFKPQHEPERDHSLADLNTAVNTAKPPSSSPSTLSPCVPTHKPPHLTPPYTPLSALISPTLPSRNHNLTTLAIITYVSTNLLNKSNSPFPPKRNIRLLDPSLSQSAHPQGFSLAVYVDAQSFLPVPGTIALFRGIVMQRFGREIILNAYATLKDKPANEKWYIDNETTLEDMGFDVRGMRSWWDDRVSKNAKRSGKDSVPG